MVVTIQEAKEREGTYVGRSLWTNWDTAWVIFNKRISPNVFKFYELYSEWRRTPINDGRYPDYDRRR